MGVPNNICFIREDPAKVDDLGIPLFSETTIYNSPLADLSFGAILHWSILAKPINFRPTLPVLHDRNKLRHVRKVHTDHLDTLHTDHVVIIPSWGQQSPMRQWLLDSPSRQILQILLWLNAVPISRLMLRADFDLRPLQMFNEIHQNLPRGVHVPTLGVKESWGKQGCYHKSP